MVSKVRARQAGVLLLAAVWVVLATAKAFSPDREAVFLPILGGDWAPAATWAVVALEFVLGLALVLPRPRTNRIALLISLGLLLVYGAHAVLTQPVQCTCAGRLARLSPLAHAVLTASMLALVALGLSTPEKNPPSQGRQRLRVALLCGLAVMVGVGLALATRTSVKTIAGEPLDVLVPAQPLPDLAVPPAVVSRPSVGGKPPAEAASTATVPGLRGVVVNEAGDGVPSADVWLAGAAVGFQTREQAKVVQADTQGHFVIPHVGEESNSLHICVAARSYQPTCRLIEGRTDAASEVRIVLQRGRCVRGTVIDDLGGAVTGARVEAVGVLGEEMREGGAILFGPAATPEYADALAGADGTFELCGLSPAGRYVLSASAVGYFSESRAGVNATPVPEDGTSVTLRLHRLFALNAIAVDAVSSRPLKFATYGVALASGGAWLPSGDSAIRFSPGFVAADSVLTERGAWSVFRLSTPNGRQDPIRVIVDAPGYAKRVVDVPLFPAAETRAPVAIAMQADASGPTTSTHFRAVWKSGRGLDGSLVLRIRRIGGSFAAFPVVFRAGECREPIDLPAGGYEAGLLPHEASTAFWHRPTEAVMTKFDVPGPADSTVTFRLVGGALVLGPKTEGGALVTEFTVSITGKNTAHTQDTWRFPLPLQRSQDDDPGTVFLLEPGPLDVVLKKNGFVGVKTSLQVPDDGSSVHWDPTLVRAPAR